MTARHLLVLAAAFLLVSTHSLPAGQSSPWKPEIRTFVRTRCICRGASRPGTGRCSSASDRNR
jgi:hypothetical protein